MRENFEPQKNLDNVAVELDDDIIFCTIAKYKLLMSYGAVGRDAFSLYSHLMFTAKMQKTNVVKATERYNRNGLEWGVERYRNAKKLLEQLGIITGVQKKNKDGRIIGYYLAVKAKSSPFEDLPVVSKPSSGPAVEWENRPLNALTNNINALTNNGNALTTIGSAEAPPIVDKKSKQKSYPEKTKTLPEINTKYLDYWNSMPNLRHHRPDSSAAIKATAMCQAAVAGELWRFVEINSDYAKMNNISDSDLRLKYSDDEIFQAIGRFDSMNDPEKNGKDNRLPADFDKFMFNSRTKTSIFITKVGSGKDPLPFLEKCSDEKAYEMYRSAFFRKNMSLSEVNDLSRSVNVLIKKQKEFSEKTVRYTKLREYGWHRVFIDFLRDKYYDLGQFSAMVIRRRDVWQQYLIWLKNEHKINLEERIA